MQALLRAGSTAGARAAGRWGLACFAGYIYLYLILFLIFIFILDIFLILIYFNKYLLEWRTGGASVCFQYL